MHGYPKSFGGGGILEEGERDRTCACLADRRLDAVSLGPPDRIARALGFLLR
ncbi:uncharacterized protein MCYG_04685 [Microsporum canis CBS 113480]|uniref:Uncharacterized protein n=1 Tax=Arthroderma otae (strain ATCC MYA-4605 / CBS 113480) TaxID=554155 RepID=C5FP13_ARTOC|nr:uncharacterized protein MCYG_04685 [Microsporum canis CBS 113480]EEQ31866.1 predicted protein [Microsporum canis CBS 113480]